MRKPWHTVSTVAYTNRGYSYIGGFFWTKKAAEKHMKFANDTEITPEEWSTGLRSWTVVVKRTTTETLADLGKRFAVWGEDR